MKTFQVKKLTAADASLFQQLISLFREVFEEETTTKVSGDHLKKLLEKPEFIVYVAFSENEIVAGLTAHEFSAYYSESSEIYIYDIAVKTEFQRNGLGKLLMNALKKYASENNISVMFVEAHEADQHAVDFYRSTGGKAEKVVHFNYYTE